MPYAEAEAEAEEIENSYATKELVAFTLNKCTQALEPKQTKKFMIYDINMSLLKFKL